MCGIFAIINNIESDLNDYMTYFNRISHRGPDDHVIKKIDDSVIFGFHRLSIIDVSNKGMQPFQYKNENVYIICNGEIYNHVELKNKYNLKPQSDSDCEIILQMYVKFGIDKTINELDGVFSFIIYDHGTIIIGRDPIGVRPLFIGINNSKTKICFSSEIKAINEISDSIEPFLPGKYMIINKNSSPYYIPYYNLNKNIVINNNLETGLQLVKDSLINAVKKRLMSDRPIGYMLSGGLDSSIITSIASKLSSTPLKTFSIGMKDSNAPDLYYAKKVSEYLKTDHTSIEYSLEEGLNMLEDVIKTIESYDVTTVRASLPQYILSNYIKENTDITVVFSGEGPDEHFGGYQYFKMAPSEDEFRRETIELTENLYYFDVLRTDRTTCAFSLEVRVPFLDKEFIKTSLSLPTHFKMSTDKIEKYMIRKAFDDNTYLPDEILWRSKNAMSDAVGYGWVDGIKEYVNTIITDEEFKTEAPKYEHNTPYSKESYYYRKLFEKHYPNHNKLISKFWMPCRDWCKNGEKINDPSALKLKCFTE